MAMLNKSIIFLSLFKVKHLLPLIVLPLHLNEQGIWHRLAADSNHGFRVGALREVVLLLPPCHIGGLWAARGCHEVPVLALGFGQVPLEVGPSRVSRRHQLAFLHVALGYHVVFLDFLSQVLQVDLSLAIKMGSELNLLYLKPPLSVLFEWFQLNILMAPPVPVLIINESESLLGFGRLYPLF